MIVCYVSVLFSDVLKRDDVKIWPEVISHLLPIFSAKVGTAMAPKVLGTADLVKAENQPKLKGSDSHWVADKDIKKPIKDWSMGPSTSPNPKRNHTKGCNSAQEHE